MPKRTPNASHFLREFARSRFDAVTMQSIAKDFVRLAKVYADNPDFKSGRKEQRLNNRRQKLRRRELAYIHQFMESKRSARHQVSVSSPQVVAAGAESGAPIRKSASTTLPEHIQEAQNVLDILGKEPSINKIKKLRNKSKRIQQGKVLNPERVVNSSAQDIGAPDKEHQTRNPELEPAISKENSSEKKVIKEKAVSSKKEKKVIVEQQQRLNELLKDEINRDRPIVL